MYLRLFIDNTTLQNYHCYGVRNYYFIEHMMNVDVLSYPKINSNFHLGGLNCLNQSDM
jgi:hypothetical protein